MNRLLLYLIVCLFAISCNGIKSIVSTSSPHEQYDKSIQRAGLSRTSLYLSWKEAGENAFVNPLEVPLPFAEAAYFQAGKPMALSYQFQIEDGQVVTSTVKAKKSIPGNLFIDLFVWKDGKWKELVSADSSLTLTYEFDERSTCLIRIQPELLVNVYLSLDIRVFPALINPVKGATNQSIKSLYGVDRDGGSRRHEGIDIFAKKGTLVIAPTSGYIARVGVTNLGGKVVWMFDTKRGHSYYFAHLDSQLVQVGQLVKQGDNIGWVGNSGNAKYTPAHLHFGIYKRGSKDPIAYIRSIEQIVESSTIDTTLATSVYKVQKDGQLLVGPTVQSMSKVSLKANTYLEVMGVSGTWYHVQLPNKTQGYIQKKKVIPALKGSFKVVVESTELLQAPDEEAIPLAHLVTGSKVEVLAEYFQYVFARTNQGKVGWLKKEL